jgi:hypothetical protein
MFNSINNTSTECLYTCGGDCMTGILFGVMCLVWMCCVCALCLKNKIQKDVMHMTGLNHDEEEGLVFNDNLVVVGRNIEKPPEYIE